MSEKKPPSTSDRTRATVKDLARFMPGYKAPKPEPILTISVNLLCSQPGCTASAKTQGRRTGREGKGDYTFAPPAGWSIGKDEPVPIGDGESAELRVAAFCPEHK